jgi:hypothetical protein
MTVANQIPDEKKPFILKTGILCSNVKFIPQNGKG